MNELQAGVEQALAVLPHPPVLLQPRKAALHDSALVHHLERMQCTALGDLHRDMPTQYLLHALRERMARVTAVAKQALRGSSRACNA